MIRSAIVLTCLLIPATLWAENVVCVEAESADTVSAPMRVVDFKKARTNDAITAVKGASADKYLEIPKQRPAVPADTPADKDCAEPPRKGCATITIEIPENGQYYLWGRTWWTDECRNSITVSVDKKPGFTFGDDRTFKCWHWIKSLKKLKLTKGKHSLLLKQREPGVRIDQILLTNDRRYVPVGIEDSGKRK